MDSRAERCLARESRAMSAPEQARCLADLESSWAALDQGQEIFVEYARWLRVLLSWTGLPAEDLERSLEHMKVVATEDSDDGALAAILAAQENSSRPLQKLALLRPKSTWKTDDISVAFREYSVDLALISVSLHYLRNPALALKHGRRGQERCIEDVTRHIERLGEALRADALVQFLDYIGWVYCVLESLGIAGKALGRMLETIRDVISMSFAAGTREPAVALLTAALASLERESHRPESFIDTSTATGQLARTYLDRLLAGERRPAFTLILGAARSGTSVSEIYAGVFTPALSEVGRLWQLGELSIAMEHFCTAATQSLMSQLYPFLEIGPAKDRVIIATAIEGNDHEVGARMVADYFEIDGWTAHYLGANTPVGSLMDCLVQRKADLLAVSASMPTQIPHLESILAQLRSRPETKFIPVIVGGGLFRSDRRLWEFLGADGYAPTAESALELGNRLVDERRNSR